MSDEHVTKRQAEGQRQWSKLVERASKDAELKQRLLNDPAPLLREAGIEVPAGAAVRVTEEKGSLNCVIESGKAAAAAAGTELTEGDLTSVVGGAGGNAPVEYLKIKLTDILISG
jgi:hypothetical protein